MDKKDILDRYKKVEDKLLISKFFDKIELCDKTNKIETTDFLNELEQSILKKVITLANIDNCVFYGGFNDADRKIAIVFPEKMRAIIENENFKYDTVFSVFRIKIPEAEIKDYNHSVYLGGMIKLGVKREKIGDILVQSYGADLIVKREIEKFLFANIKTLTRFRDAEVNNISLAEMSSSEKKFEDIKLITSSLRLDNIVAELAKTSRNKANEIIEQDRVLINYEQESKNTKILKVKDIVTIRGKGKFIIEDVVGNTKKGNYIVMIKKYA
jgi:RNA-binding protein YlmH